MYTIGKVAAMADISANTLRYYEREGLIQPISKGENGYRLYNDQAVSRLRFIKQAQHCGFSLSEIAELLTLQARDSACCSDIRQLTVEKKLQVEAKIKAMKAISKALDILIADCADDSRPASDCPILGALERVNGEARS
jgi:MerR family Zn(II)-responsive transcriptional regulator of zntA